MSQDMEQIEARLAGYIDGTLPPDQRAEIEAYLAANPGHGRLISELRSIKAALGNLPRDKAPAEVMDAIQGQLERHALLDGVEDHGPARINRWPQLGAVAAMLLLMAGLGLLVYQVLPRDKAADQSLALLPTSSRAIVPDSELPDAQPVTLDAAPTDPAAPPMRKAESLKMLASPATKLGETVGQDAADGAIQQRTTRLSDALVVAQEPVQTPSPSPIEVGPLVIGGATTRPRDTAGGAAAATRPDGVGYVVIETADPVMTRNLMAATLSAAGHPTEAGAVKASAAPATAPTSTDSSGHVDSLAPAGPGRPEVDVVRDQMSRDQITVGDAYLLVRDLQTADVERLRIAATGVHGTVIADRAAATQAATTAAAKNWMLIFHAASPTPAAAASAGLASASTAPAARATTAPSKTPTTSPAAPALQEMP